MYVCVYAYYLCDGVRHTHRKKVAEHQRAERERAAAAKEAERLRAEVAEAKQRRAELQRTVSQSVPLLVLVL